MQYGNSVLRQLVISAEQRYEDENMQKSWVVFGQPGQLMIENMG